MALPARLHTSVEQTKYQSYYESMNRLSPAYDLAWYMRDGNDRGVRGSAEAMLEVRDALGDDPAGQRAFLLALEAGQHSQDASDDVNRATAKRMQEAFSYNVETGKIGPADAKKIVDELAREDKFAEEPDKNGQSHFTLTRKFALTSAYIDNLPHDGAGKAMREAFIEESYAKALELRESKPELATQLYAQMANAMADLKPNEISGYLRMIEHREGPQGIARFAAGVAAGEAERAKPTFDGDHYRADGLAKIIQAETARVEAGRESGHPDGRAEAYTAQLFTGTTAYLTAARGTALDHNLSDFDERTGLRSAMNGAMKADFQTIYRQNTRPDGDGLHQPEGYDTFAAYARFEFGAKNDAHGRATSDEAARVLGTTFGKVEADLLKAERDGGKSLRQDFGVGTFGDRTTEQANAAKALGQLLGATSNGINQDFDVRAQRNTDAQKEMKSSFATVSTISGYAAKALAKAGPEGAAPAAVATALSTAADAASKAVPLNVTPENPRGPQFDALRESFATSLSKFRPNHGFANQLDIGSAEANTHWANYQTAHAHEVWNDGALESQKGLLPGLMKKTIVPAPDSPAHPAAKVELSADQTAKLTADAVDKYNVDHPKQQLPKPADIGEWNGAKQVGTIVQLGPDDYAITPGHGQYRHIGADQLHGDVPPVGVPVTLEPDGTVEKRETAPKHERTAH